MFNEDLQPWHIALIIALVVFLATLIVAGAVRSRSQLRSRIAAGAAGVGTADPLDRRSLGYQNQQTAASMIERIGGLLQPKTGVATAALQKQLIQAGFFAPSAIIVYNLVRVLSAAVGAVSWPFIEAMLGLDMAGGLMPMTIAVGGVVGMILPSVLLDKRCAIMRNRYRNAFPDFMDLVLVCIESGQSLQGAIDRVSQEIIQFSPELGANLHLVSLELRAGRTLVDALGSFHERVGIDEVKSLQILLKQSEDLGSSIAASLRIFSDEMREKRLVRAETKAHALPVKMTIPLGLFIFPVILMVILVPIVIRIKNAFV